MKHIFIVNPIAGNGRYQRKLMADIKDAFKDKNIEYEIHITKCKGDARKFVSQKCEDDKSYRFYACGGDGTLHEVINGAYGHKHVSVGLIPCGSGNDFVRNFIGFEVFLSIDAQINGEDETIDIIKCQDEYAVSVCNIGFDADVAFNMHKFKNVPFITGSGCYVMSVLYCLLKKMGKSLAVSFDTGESIKGNFLLGVIANGHSYGGGYKCAPSACIDDGMIDICFIQKISRFKIIKLLGIYKAGKHLEDDSVKKYITYRKCQNIKIKSDNPINVCIDGEIYIYDGIEFGVVKNAIKFAVPRGAEVGTCIKICN